MLQYAHKCSKWPFSPFNLGNTSIYSPLSKTSHYGPIAPFLRTRGQSAIQSRTVRTRIPTAINGYKKCQNIQKRLADGLPLKVGRSAIHKTEPKRSFADSAHLLKFVLWTVRTWTPDDPQYKIFVMRTVRTQAPDGPQFKKENQNRTSRVLSKHESFNYEWSAT
jgi:hypothetical protein